ncbi:hypothetical protein Hanom_Chr02g00170581 [Helianthus anomalus]
MPTSTYPKEWKSRFIFVYAAMIPESPPLRNAKAVIEDSIPVLSTDEIVKWKRMFENPTRAFTFPEGILAMGGLRPSYQDRPKAFVGKKEMTLWGLLQGDCKDVKFMVGDKIEPSMSRGVEKKATEGSVQAGDSALPATRATSELPPTGVKGSLYKDLRSSSLVSEPLLGSSNDLIEIPTAPSFSRVRDKTPEVSAARIASTFEVSYLHATGTSKPSHLEGFVSRSPLAPLFVDALPVLYGAGAILEQKERAWAREMEALVEEKKELAAELKHQKELDSVSQTKLDAMYAEWGITSDDNQKLAKEKYWLITEGFRSFLTAVSQSEEFKSSLEHIYRAYWDVGYQSDLKKGYAYSAQGLGRKEIHLYNSKAKKRLSKLDKEFGGKTPALLEKILERPLMSIDELKALRTPVGPSSPKSLSGDDSQ